MVQFHFFKECPNHYDLVCKKGLYPYEWVDALSKLDYKGLPPIAELYSSLSQEGIAKEEYEHALIIYDKTKL